MYGLGKHAGLSEGKAEVLGGGLLALLASTPESAAAVVVDAGSGLAAPRAAAHMAYGARLRSYRLDKYRTKLKPEDRPKLDRIVFMVAGSATAQRDFAPLDKVADAVCFARDLVAEPPNVIYPESMAQRIKALTKLGLTVEVLGMRELRKHAMGALL